MKVGEAGQVILDLVSDPANAGSHRVGVHNNDGEQDEFFVNDATWNKAVALAKQMKMEYKVREAG